MGVNFNTKWNITSSGYGMLKCYGRIYVKFKEEWRRIDEKNENKGRKIHDERFPDNFQATFTSQLVEIGIGFIDCKIFFCPILN